MRSYNLVTSHFENHAIHLFFLPETLCTLNESKIKALLYYLRKRMLWLVLPFEVNFTHVLILSFSFQSLPASIANLHSLQSLSLHSNKLSTLPPQIVNLCLVELSLRNNPLVVSTCIQITHDTALNEFAYGESLAKTSN